MFVMRDTPTADIAKHKINELAVVWAPSSRQGAVVSNNAFMSSPRMSLSHVWAGDPLYINIVSTMHPAVVSEQKLLEVLC